MTYLFDQKEIDGGLETRYYPKSHEAIELTKFMVDTLYLTDVDREACSLCGINFQIENKKWLDQFEKAKNFVKLQEELNG